MLLSFLRTAILPRKVRLQVDSNCKHDCDVTTNRKMLDGPMAPVAVSAEWVRQIVVAMKKSCIKGIWQKMYMFSLFEETLKIVTNAFYSLSFSSPLFEIFANENTSYLPFCFIMRSN